MKQKKITIGKWGQKELLVFHGQLNCYIFHTFHNKMGFTFTGLIRISSNNISSYVHKSYFYFIRKRWF